MTQEARGSDPSSFLDEVIEAGQRKIQRNYRVALRDICENNNINEGDIIIVYIKKNKKI